MIQGNIQATGLLFYNGFQFPGPVHVRVAGTPQRDSTARYTKFTRYRFTVEAIITAEMEADRVSAGSAVGSFFPTGKTIDGRSDSVPYVVDMTLATINATTEGMTKLRAALMEQGKQFVFLGKGLGQDWNIHTIRNDTDYGPKPISFYWEPIGDDRAARIVWEVEVTVSDCIPNTQQLGFVSEFSFEAEYSIDAMGLTSRAINGEVHIINKLDPTTGVPLANLDVVRSRFNFPVPDGFQRVANSWVMNTRRDVMKFKLVDTEHPSDNPLHPSIVTIDARQRVENSGMLTTNVWNISINANITVAFGAPRWYAWLAFQQIVKSRLDIAIKKGTVEEPENSGSSSSATKRKGVVPILRNFFIEEEIFGRSMSFGIQYKLYNSLGTIFEASGLWEPISSTNSWKSYGESMKKVYSPRGVSNIFHNQRDDAVIQLCKPKTGTTTSSFSPNRITTNRRAFFHEWQKPEEAEKSWVVFKHQIQFKQQTNAIAHTPLGGRDTQVAVSPNGTNTNLVGYIKSRTQDPIVQSRTSSTWYVVFTGRAMRLGYEIPVPRLRSVGGVPVVAPIGDTHFHSKIVGTQGSVRLYAAVWAQVYALSGPPQGQTYTLDPDMREFDYE